LEKRKGINSSGPVFIFWFLLAACGAPTYRSYLASSGVLHDAPTFPFALYLLYYPLVIVMFALNCFADAVPIKLIDTQQGSAENEEDSRPECPEYNASFLSRITFSWFDKLAWLGYRNPLTPEDLWALNDVDKSKTVVPVFDHHWEKARRKAILKAQRKNLVNKLKTRSVSMQYKAEGVEIKSSRKLLDGEKGEPIVTKTESAAVKTDASILGPIVKTFGPTFFMGSVLKVAHDLLAFVSPMVLE
jgi:ATP-binding cassette subfamily C (CFTR/MRP) protein 1